MRACRRLSAAPAKPRPAATASGRLFRGAHLHDEAGWREHSAARCARGSSSRLQDARTISTCRSRLRTTRCKARSASFLDARRAAQGLHLARRTDNELAFLTARASRFIQSDVLVSRASICARSIRIPSPATSTTTSTRAVGRSGQHPGFNDRGALVQRSAGAALQLVMSQELAESVHELTSAHRSTPRRRRTRRTARKRR